MDECELIEQGLFDDRQRVIAEKDAQIATLTAERDAARAVLGEVEQYDFTCPACAEGYRLGHALEAMAPDLRCRLDKARGKT